MPVERNAVEPDDPGRIVRLRPGPRPLRRGVRRSVPTVSSSWAVAASRKNSMPTSVGFRGVPTFRAAAESRVPGPTRSVRQSMTRRSSATADVPTPAAAAARSTTVPASSVVMTSFRSPARTPSPSRPAMNSRPTESGAVTSRLAPAGILSESVPLSSSSNSYGSVVAMSVMLNPPHRRRSRRSVRPLVLPVRPRSRCRPG